MICLRFGRGTDWEPSPEDPKVTEARNELLALLERVGAAIPGDRWVLGQRIRYLGDGGRWDEARALARECDVASPWWCSALWGYVLHRSGRGEESLMAFRRALAAMEPGEAAGWWDPRVLLDFPEARWLDEAGELDRQEARSRFWRLANPLFLIPGNSRFTEHLARVFASSEIYHGSVVTLGLAWGGAMEEVFLRYGFAAGWERTRPGMGELAGGSVVEHQHPESRSHLPPLEALDDPAGLVEGVWVPRDERPRAASAPVLAPLLVEGKGQTAALRREGELLVVARYAPPAEDTLLTEMRPLRRSGRGPGTTDGEGPLRPPWEPAVDGEGRDTLAGLFLLPVAGNGEPLGETRRGGEGLLFLRAPPGGYLVSLELWSPSGRWGARLRHGIRREAVPPDVPTLSDLLLLGPAESPPRDLEEAIPRMLPGTVLERGEPVTVAWEVYGLGGRREPLAFTLSVRDEEASLIRRAFERIGLFRRTPPLSLSWTEAGADALGPLFRAVDVTLPAVDPGPYVLRLEMEMPGRTAVVWGRRITIR